MDLEPLKIDRSRARRRPSGGGVGRGLGIAVLVVGLILAWLLRAPRDAPARPGPAPAGQDLQGRPERPRDGWRDPGSSRQRLRGRGQAGSALGGHAGADRRAPRDRGLRGEKGQLVARLLDEEYAAAVARTEADLAQARPPLSGPRLRSRAPRPSWPRTWSRAKPRRPPSRPPRPTSAWPRSSCGGPGSCARRRSTPPATWTEPWPPSDRAKASLGQAKALLRAGKNATEGAEAQVELARADLAVAQARVKVASAARDQAAAILRKTEVRAPFKGIVVLKDAEVGEVVSPNSMGGSNARGSVADPGRLRLPRGPGRPP